MSQLRSNLRRPYPAKQGGRIYILYSLLTFRLGSRFDCSAWTSSPHLLLPSPPHRSINRSINPSMHPSNQINQSINQSNNRAINPIKQAIKYRARVCHPASSIFDSMLQDSMGYHFGLFWYPRVWVTECKHCSIKHSSWVISAAAPTISCACGCRCSELPFGPARAGYRRQGGCSSCSGSSR